LIERLLAKLLTDVIITISQQQHFEIFNKFSIGTVQQHRVIPYGLDFSTSPGPSLHNILGIKSDVPIVGLIGRLCEIKNPSLFIQAAQILKAKQLNFKFVIIGDGHLRSDLELLVADLDLVDTVLFTGFRDDVMNLYSDLQIITITSLNEGTPFTLIEAMNFGVPVVSTQVGGVIDLMGQKINLTDLPDGIESWENGLTVSSKDIVSFANAVQFLIEHNEVANKMGCRAIEFVRRNYSKQRFVEDMSGLYRDLTTIN
jgi:glycosyltransferase involved in cell wall biosynthesis